MTSQLRVSTERRAQLLGDNHLAINSRDQEVLCGLTFEESQFLIDCGEVPQRDTAAMDRCDDLLRKHERARLRIAIADDESSADELRRPLTAKL
jgi:hypothetical protein